MNKTNLHTKSAIISYVAFVLVVFFIVGQPVIKALTFDADTEIVSLEIDSESDGEEKDTNETEAEGSEEEKITSSIDVVKLYQSRLGATRISSISMLQFNSIYLEVNIPPPEQA